MFSIYSAGNEFLGEIVYPEESLMLVGVLGEGATIKYRGSIVWTEGVNGKATDSYDYAADFIRLQIQKQEVKDNG